MRAQPASFWLNDDGWQIAWPAALAFATLFHGFAFFSASNAPVRKMQERVTMSVVQPPPPPPPPELEPPPPPPPPPKPKKAQKLDEPPPPNKEVPQDTPPPETPPQVVTGVTAESVVASNAGGPQVRVGNTTFGNPDEEKFVKPENLQQLAAKNPFDYNRYKSTIYEIMDREKQYPRKARVLGLTGKCMVKMLLNKDGSLAAPPKLLVKTGHDVLDAECLRLATAKKFPPPEGDDITFPVTVNQPIVFSQTDP